MKKVSLFTAAACQGMSFEHEAVNHSVGAYVRGMAHTNGIESFWSTRKRGHNGIYHKMSPKHLDRYVTEFAGRHNVRDAEELPEKQVERRKLHTPAPWRDDWTIDEHSQWNWSPSHSLDHDEPRNWSGC